MKTFVNIFFVLVCAVIALPVVNAETPVNLVAAIEVQSLTSWMDVAEQQAGAQDLKGLITQDKLAQLPKCNTGACPAGCRQSDNTCGDGSRCCDKVQVGKACKNCTTP